MNERLSREAQLRRIAEEDRLKAWSETEPAAKAKLLKTAEIAEMLLEHEASAPTVRCSRADTDLIRTSRTGSAPWLRARPGSY